MVSRPHSRAAQAATLTASEARRLRRSQKQSNAAPISVVKKAAEIDEAANALVADGTAAVDMNVVGPSAMLLSTANEAAPRQDGASSGHHTTPPNNADADTLRA